MKMKNGLRLLLCLTIFVFADRGMAKKNPSVTIEAESSFFSPNKDGVQDEIIFKIQAIQLKSVLSWELQFQDSAGVVRKTISGTKKLPASIIWDGSDDFGAPCLEGAYQVSFKAWDEKNQLLSAPPLRVVLDLTPPTISLTAPTKTFFLPLLKTEGKEGTIPPPVYTPKVGQDPQTGGGTIPSATFYFSAVDLSGIAKWKLQMLDSNKQEFFSEDSTAPLPAAWRLSGKKVSIPIGKTTAILFVTDQAGNRGSSPPIELEVQTQSEQKSAPAEKGEVEQFLQWTNILSISDLFGKDADNQSALSPQASVLLDPLAKAILDSPGARTTILGHVDSRKNPKEEKALSSYFAWRVYSYFVRQKGVDKNAIAVKGLGADVPIADNRTLLGRARNRRIEMQIFLPAGRREAP